MRYIVYYRTVCSGSALIETDPQIYRGSHHHVTLSGRVRAADRLYRRRQRLLGRMQIDLLTKHWNYYKMRLEIICASVWPMHVVVHKRTTSRIDRLRRDDHTPQSQTILESMSASEFRVQSNPDQAYRASGLD